jgi:hypothetical protein
MKQRVLQTILSAIACVFAHAGSASTLAYWRFEGNGTNAPTAGALMTGFAQHTAVQSNGILAVDSSGNGNTLYAWDSNPAGYNGFWIEYENFVPDSIMPQTGANNSWAIWTVPFGNNYPAIATWSAVSHPTGTDIETVDLKAWTVEASIYCTSFAGQFHTFVGRDGNHVANIDAGQSPLYFSVYNYFPNLTNLTIKFMDRAGTYYDLYDTVSLELNHWYNVAAVSDGTNLFLYKDSTDGNSYQLVGTLPLTSTNTAMAIPTGAYSTMSDGSTWAWSVARGRYGTSPNPQDNHVDRFYGYIDEVRISDTALQPSQFLFAVPKRPIITSFTLEGTNAILAGTNGLPNSTCYVLTTSDLTLPRSSWTRIATNAFDSIGNFSFTNSTPASIGQSFYMLQLP